MCELDADNETVNSVVVKCVWPLGRHNPGRHAALSQLFTDDQRSSHEMTHNAGGNTLQVGVSHETIDILFLNLFLGAVRSLPRLELYRASRKQICVIKEQSRRTKLMEFSKNVLITTG